MDTYRIGPDSHIDLASLDTRDTAAFPDLSKKTSRAVLREMNRELSQLQRLFWADGSHGLILVLQAMDTAGKDGTIRKVFSGVNPQGVDVWGFGVPGPHEAARDYLWRIHQRTPPRGRIAVFNRSHYEDVLVVRVNELAPREVWSRRYEHIRNFEAMLHDEGTTVIKVMLNISKGEQRRRLQARIDDPTKNYKFNPSDLTAREDWDAYMEAYVDVLNRTSTENSPWHVVPADRKWYRNLVVSSILIDTIKNMNLAYPKADFDPSGIVIP